MSVESTQTEGESSETELTSKDANNFIRGHEIGCLIITEEVQGEEIETVFITVDRTYFRVQEFGTPAKVKRFTMSQALEAAQEADNKTARLAAYPQSDLDIEGAVEFIHENFELDAEEVKGGYGLPRDELDKADDEHLDIASAPAGTSDVHGGGW